VLTAVYPPAEVRSLQFANYKAVEKAFAEKKPNQAILYQPDGNPIDIVFVPLIHGDQVAGILALGFQGNIVRDKRGLVTQEFLSLNFGLPNMRLLQLVLERWDQISRTPTPWRRFRKS
jgi:hypothetical protein